MNKKLAYIVVGAATLLCSCSEHGWSVDGTINNAADGAKVSVEGFNAGRWYTIDSVEVKSNGKFSYQSPVGAPHPDIFRVSLDGKYIYFPIDSLENVTVTANADNFDIDYTLTGWPVADQMYSIDKRIHESISAQGNQATLNDSVLKRELGTAVNDDPSGLLGYYIINKTIGGEPIFSTTNRADLRIIGAIANKFMTQYPGDPRTVYLAERFLRGRAQLNPDAQPSRVIEANEAGLFDIELYDAKGNKQKLSEIAKNSGLTVLSFTSYQMDNSVAYNVELNKAYEKYRPQNLSIYQVAIDNDEVRWRNSAQNLPWTAVYYDQKDGGSIIRLYNVAVVPTTYIIDSNGDLVDRVDDPTKLDEIISKHIK